MSEIMQLAQYIDKDNLHHAYLIEGEHAAVLPVVLAFLHDTLAVDHAANPNVSQELYELFTIDHARSLRTRQSERGNGKKFFILGIRFFTREAEHALLKMFEEPSTDTHFFLIMPSADMLLPTLRSRLLVIRAQENIASRDAVTFRGQEFLRLSKAERLHYIADMLEEYDDDAKHEMLKGVAVALLDGIELALRASLGNAIASAEQQLAFKEVLICKSYMRDRGASTKMLLEYIALILP
jgi:hypothetical protein